MIRKWITATRKTKGRTALIDNEVANEWEEISTIPQDMAAKGWAQYGER
jgi:hypothetical protein